MRITYLTNLYPAVSHTFVRREILALERMGYQIDRLTIRSPHGLVDPVDQAEAAKTTAIVDMPKGRLFGLMYQILQRRPIEAVAALVWAMEHSRRTGIRLRKMLVYLVEAMVVAALCRRNGTELLRVHFGTNGAVVARLARRLGGPPYSVAYHGPDEFDAPERWDLAGTIAESLFVTAITHYCAAQLMRWSDPADWHRIEIVRCAVDETFLTALPLPAPGVVRRVCIVARLAPQKGLPLLLYAFARVDAPLALDIVGGGPARGALEAQAATLGIADRVRFHGPLSGEGVRGVMAASHALVLPSFAEGLPVVLMEAMGLGRPAIATAIMGVPELVRDGENGWLIPPGDVAALTAALEQLAAMPDAQIAEMGHAANAAVRARHAIDDQAQVLSEAIGRRTDDRSMPDRSVRNFKR